MKHIFLSLPVLLATNAFAQRNQDSLVRESQKTEIWQPVPRIVTPGATDREAPSDAVVLYNGSSLDAWVKESDNKAPGWKIDADGAMTVVKASGNIKTKRSFGDCQLHIEWRQPAEVAGSSQSRGNSGVFFMGRYELQVLDSYNNPTYVNGQAGSIYKQHIPLVNASRKPGEWQSYDVIFTAPRFDNAGKVLSPARITVFHNGVLVQNNVEIKGSTQWIGQPAYEKHGSKEPLVLQDHGRDGGNPISYRNIWIRDL